MNNRPHIKRLDAGGVPGKNQNSQQTKDTHEHKNTSSLMRHATLFGSQESQGAQTEKNMRKL